MKRCVHASIMPQRSADRETLAFEGSRRAHRAGRDHRSAKPGGGGGSRDGAGDQAQFYCNSFAAIAPLHHRPQPLKQGTVAAGRGCPDGAQTLH